MKYKILYFFIGNSPEYLMQAVSNSMEGLMLVDDQILSDNIPGAGDGEQNIHKVCLSNYDKLELDLNEMEEIKNIIICPLIHSNKPHNEFLKDIENLMEKMVAVLKEISKMAMYNRNMNVLLMDSFPCFMDAGDNKELAEAVSAGLNIMAMVLGMELSRKGLTSNYFKVTDKKKLKELYKFILWNKDKNLYMDMQSITI